MINRVSLAAALLLFTSATALAEVVVTDRFEKTLPIAGGSVVIENVYGDVTVTGTDEPNVSWVAEKTIRGVDRAAIDEGRSKVQLRFDGTERLVFIRTLMPRYRSNRWFGSVKYTVKLPRTLDVRISAHWAERVRVADMRGSVGVTNVNGTIVLDGLSGVVAVNTANGNILVRPPAVFSNMQLETVSGNIELQAAAGANFQWFGQTLQGDAATTFPVRVQQLGNGAFRASINDPGGPTIRTSSLLGNIYVLRMGSQIASAKSVRSPEPNIPRPSQEPKVGVQTFERNYVEGPFFTWSTNIGSIAIGEIRGAARVTTGAGEVELGAVFGKCYVSSLGGPLNLGEISGRLTASTAAGDVLVHAAREGGSISTQAGTIHLLYTGGPTRLESGGGDIVVRQAAAQISAETRSGDITITVDPSSKSEKMSAKTAKGNIIVNLTPRFSADLDATLLTNDPDRHRFRSDFPGLKIERDQFNGKTRIRITGALNGGGERIDLFAEDGGIQLSSMTAGAISVLPPR